MPFSAQPFQVVPVASYPRPTWCLSLLVMYTLSSAGDTQISYRNDPCTELQLEPQLGLELEMELELELELELGLELELRKMRRKIAGK